MHYAQKELISAVDEGRSQCRWISLEVAQHYFGFLIFVKIVSQIQQRAAQVLADMLMQTSNAH